MRWDGYSGPVLDVCTYPVGGTYCLGSSQILHEGRFSWVGFENCVPQVEQMRRSKGLLGGILIDVCTP